MDLLLLFRELLVDRLVVLMLHHIVVLEEEVLV